MKELIAKLFDIGKLPSQIVCLVCIVAAALLFSPDSIHDKLHTKKLVTDYGFDVGLAFIASACLLALNIAIWFIGSAKSKLARHKHRVAALRAIARLDPAEISILREFYIQGKQTLPLPVDQATVAGLINKRIIGTVGTVGRQSMAGMLFPVALDPDIQDVLPPERLGLPPTQPTDAEIARLVAERPHFMQEVARMERWRSGIIS